MKKCKSCVCYKTRSCPKTMWVGRILLGEEKLKNNTPCEKYEYMPLMQRLERAYNKYKEIVLRRINLIRGKWRSKQAEKKLMDSTKKDITIQWDEEILKRVYNNTFKK